VFAGNGQARCSGCPATPAPQPNIGPKILAPSLRLIAISRTLTVLNNSLFSDASIKTRASTDNRSRWPAAHNSK